MLNICRFLVFMMGILLLPILSKSQTLSTGFESKKVAGNLKDPASFNFAPDGRLFYGERITGNLRVAVWNSTSNLYETLPQVFHSFNVPTTRHRSAGLRGFVFDPNFNTNGFIYAFYMLDNPRHNRVVKIQANPANPDISTGTENLLMELPYNSTTSSGSHNGGDLVFGADDKLYFTTGDGWNGGGNVQSLSTFTGKVMRINTDGSIPSDNPFYAQTTGDYRAIYALGLRNPYSLSNLSASNKIYVNDAVGANKASVFELIAGANYGHDGYNGTGTNTGAWNNLSVNGAKVIAGGAWYPSSGYWPGQYHGNYFAAFWGSNSSNAPGSITRAVSEANLTKTAFYENMLIGGELKPVMLRYGFDGNIYYLMTDYETGTGEVHRISYVGTNIVARPSFDPLPGQYNDPINVAINCADAGASIYFTIDGSDPDINGLLYSNPINISNTTDVRAKAKLAGKTSSELASGEYIIGPVPNIAPIASVIPEQKVQINQEVTLNGSASYDPDGSSVTMQESWSQVSGPLVVINDEDETVANFIPIQEGIYEFKLEVEDIYGEKDSAFTKVFCYYYIDDYLQDLIARWTMEHVSDSVLFDSSPNANNGVLDQSIIENESGDGSNTSIKFEPSVARIDIKNVDVTGDKITICFWTKLSSYSQTDARFISKANGQFDNDHLWMVSAINNDRLRFRLKTNAGGTSTLLSNTSDLPLNQWVFVAATYDGAEMKLYKDSTLINSMNKTGTIASDPNIYAAIGNQPAIASGGVRPLDGLLDEVRIYSKALSLTELKQVQKAGFKNICWKNLNLSATDPFLPETKVMDNIISNTTISTSESVIFSAGKSIELNPPFRVNSGGVFTSLIDGCKE